MGRQLGRAALREDEVEISDEALRSIVADYTREAGVRNLQRAIASVCRKVAKEVAQGKSARKQITPEIVAELLGAPKYFDEVANIPPKDWHKYFHRAANERQLRALLASAEGQLTAIEQTLDQRRDYVAEFERKQRGRSSAAPAVTNAPPR